MSTIQGNISFSGRSCTFLSGGSMYINGRIDTDERFILPCCEVVAGQLGIGFSDTAEETLARFLGMRQLCLIGDTGKSPCSGVCVNCSNFIESEWRPKSKLTYISLSVYPSPCQGRCIYCNVDHRFYDTPEVRSAYEKLFDLLHYAKNCGVISSHAKWQLSSGEISIHPYKKELIGLTKGNSALFFTNAFLFDEDIAENLRENADSGINLSIDSGTRETFQRVKGLDKFDDVVETLFRYKQCGKAAGQVQLKYILLPGVNDRVEDFEGLAELMNRLGEARLWIARNASDKYGSSSELKERVIASTSQLWAICEANHIETYILPSHYTLDEIAEIERRVWEDAANRRQYI